MQFLFLFYFLAPAFGARVVCYWNGKSFWREGAAKVAVDDLKPAANLCTHLIYGFAGINNDNYHLEPIDKKLDWDKDGKGQRQWKKVLELKKAHPSLSIMLSVGGYEDTVDANKYLKLLEKSHRRAAFVDSIIELLREYNFDGIDLAWQFPHVEGKSKSVLGSMWHSITSAFGADIHERAALHRDLFFALCRELKAELRPDRKLLSIAILPHINSSAYFDVRQLSPEVDMVNLWAVDFQTPERSPEVADYPHPTAHVHPREPHHNARAVLNQWLHHGADPNKLNLGIATWGRSWTLTSASGVSGSPPIKADGPGEKGPHTKTSGLLSYNEICIRLVSPTNPKADAGGLRRVSIADKTLGAYAYVLPDKQSSRGLWVGYEEPETTAVKTSLAKSKGLGGVAILDLSFDDTKGVCDGNKFPITRAAKFNVDYSMVPSYPAQTIFEAKNQSKKANR